MLEFSEIVEWAYFENGLNIINSLPVVPSASKHGGASPRARRLQAKRTWRRDSTYTLQRQLCETRQKLWKLHE